MIICHIPYILAYNVNLKYPKFENLKSVVCSVLWLILILHIVREPIFFQKQLKNTILQKRKWNTFIEQFSISRGFTVKQCQRNITLKNIFFFKSSSIQFYHYYITSSADKLKHCKPQGLRNSQTRGESKTDVYISQSWPYMTANQPNYTKYLHSKAI